MNFRNINKVIFSPGTSIKDVMERFNDTAILTGGKGFGMIVNEGRECTGVITEGDIRGALLSGFGMDEPVTNVMNKDFVSAETGDNWHSILRQFDHGVKQIPQLDKNKKPKDLYIYETFSATTRSIPHIIRARVPVRVSFSGGGTDLSHYINKQPTAVLSSTINKYCTASVLIRQDQEIHITSKDMGVSYRAHSINDIAYGDSLDLIKATVKVMRPYFGFDLETLAEFEPGTGLGGSSAVVVAVCGALNYFRDEHHLDLYHIADLAYQAERIELGIEGGWQDQYATAFGGFNWIEFRQNEVVVNPLRIHRDTLLELEYNLMMFRVGNLHDSSKIQKQHLTDMKSNENAKAEQYAQMREMAIEMKESLLKNKLKRFGDLLHSSWELKKVINNRVSTPQIEECYETARDLGALGGKLLGAGGGGYLLIYASSLYQKAIQQALEEKGAKLERFKFGSKGLEVWSTPR